MPECLCEAGRQRVEQDRPGALGGEERTVLAGAGEHEAGERLALMVSEPAGACSRGDELRQRGNPGRILAPDDTDRPVQPT